MQPNPPIPATRPDDVSAIAEAATQWRRSLHSMPELMFDVHETGDFVAKRLTEFGVDQIVRGIGRTGLVGLIRGQGDGPVIGLRSDMDALPIEEATGLSYASKRRGKMHACGHDGHMAMLLGAARQLAESRRFSGSVAVIFQPAEEGGGGGRAMVEDGMMERFSISEVYGMHNMPGLEAGHFAIRTGPIMAAADRFRITVKGRGGHAAKPHETIDPVMIAAQIIVAAQTIAARSVNPVEGCVVSFTKFTGGEVFNVIPEKVDLLGTVRALSDEAREIAESRLRDIVNGIAATFGATAEIDYWRGYPVTRNHEKETGHAVAAASAVSGEAAVDAKAAPVMGAEDFSYMLNARPGAFIFIGNGPSAGLHHPAFDFNDAILPQGIAYWATLAEQRLAALAG
jgi:amidohydrolase